MELSEEAEANLARFERRITGRKWSSKTTRQYLLWAERLLLWAETQGELDSAEGVMFDFDEYLSSLPEDPPWSGNKREGEGFSYRTRIQALSAVKLFLELMVGARIDRDVDEFVSGEEPEFEPEWYTKEETEKIFREAENCSYPHCLVMTRLGYDCILRVRDGMLIFPV
ncbi:hypothetical protein AKJ40_02150 [candidate division MSBL1 archaeon SCGC-AAA259M10]|uniref:Core-binding (CB) domain-containing protein n=2 Tax=candidate division MSBL1 TaxID=215777 RepID=A0A133U5Q7_9EURY|nr:hypothetical protein AKJ62_02950 [candidate division MSBL1 archaeon SCGC-AAA259D14]KXA99976.1 hypothetical protein AKJ40_02150 [candidate division MSBL1 archaeon SCGC-AAA259M10]